MPQVGSLPQTVLNWLRAGYPEGIPVRDYPALLGVLRRQLTSDEIHIIASEIADHASESDSPISRNDIAAMITQTVLQEASDDDVARVSARLVSGGWPLADPHGARTATSS